jgi:quercetin dioxygenase-like cupin family protein
LAAIEGSSKAMSTVSTKQVGKRAEDVNEEEGMTARLSAPLLSFDLAAEIEQLRGEERWEKDGRISKTLVKHSDFRIVLMFMKAGTSMQEHKTDARISIHALSGRLLIKLDAQTVELPVGHILVLEKSLSHDVTALEESAFLLSIAWPHGIDQQPLGSI